QCLENKLTYGDISGALARGEWHELHDGVYTYVGIELDGKRAALAAVFGAGSDAVASHITAAALHGIPGFELRDAAIHVTVAHRRGLSAVIAIFHYPRPLPSHHLAPRGRVVPVTNVARTLFGLARLGIPKRVE